MEKIKQWEPTEPWVDPSLASNKCYLLHDRGTLALTDGTILDNLFKPKPRYIGLKGNGQSSISMVNQPDIIPYYHVWNPNHLFPMLNTYMVLAFRDDDDAVIDELSAKLRQATRLHNMGIDAPNFVFYHADLNSPLAASSWNSLSTSAWLLVIQFDAPVTTVGCKALLEDLKRYPDSSLLGIFLNLAGFQDYLIEGINNDMVLPFADRTDQRTINNAHYLFNSLIRFRLPRKYRESFGYGDKYYG